MKQVKIDENIYILLEKYFLSEKFFNSKDLSDDEKLEISKFFLSKKNAREARENRVQDYYKTKELEAFYNKNFVEKEPSKLSEEEKERELNKLWDELEKTDVTDFKKKRELSEKIKKIANINQ